MKKIKADITQKQSEKIKRLNKEIKELEEEKGKRYTRLLQATKKEFLK